MLFESDKIMFEIYRALTGEHFFDGFIKNQGKDDAKGIVESILSRLNDGERLDPGEVERALGDHLT